MKIINNCIVLNSGEARIAAESLAFAEYEFIKSLSSRNIEDFVADDAGKTKALDMCRRLKEIDALIGQIKDGGAWPKDSVFTPPFSKEMRDALARMSEETMLAMFVKTSKKKEGSQG